MKAVIIKFENNDDTILVSIVDGKFHATTTIKWVAITELQDRGFNIFYSSKEFIEVFYSKKD